MACKGDIAYFIIKSIELLKCSFTMIHSFINMDIIKNLSKMRNFPGRIKLDDGPWVEDPCSRGKIRIKPHSEN